MEHPLSKRFFPKTEFHDCILGMQKILFGREVAVLAGRQGIITDFFIPGDGRTGKEESPGVHFLDDLSCDLIGEEFLPDLLGFAVLRPTVGVQHIHILTDRFLKAD